MSVPYEVLFDRYLRDHSPRWPPLPRSHPDSRIYRGKADLSQVPEAIAKTLESLQNSINTKSLPNPTPDNPLPNRRVKNPFYFDYIDSKMPNALAFESEGVCFIGITLGLLAQMIDICHKVSRAARIKALLGVELAPQSESRFGRLLFGLSIHFIITHEYAHHEMGHIESIQLNPLTVNEIHVNDEGGNLDQQTAEICADVHAIYMGLSQVLVRRHRQSLVDVLALNDKPIALQDRILLLCLVIAVSAFFMTRPLRTMATLDVYKMSHPLHVARFGLVMHFGMDWCTRHRPELGSWVSKEKLIVLTNAVAEVIVGQEGYELWTAQNAFFDSEEGSRYAEKLWERLKVRAEKESLQPQENAVDASAS